MGVRDEKDEYRGFDKDIWPQIQYHNERIYRNLELFIKITLAICGGLAYISVNKTNINKDLIIYIFRLAAGLQIMLGIYISIAIVMHTISKIRRYEDQSKLLRKSILWLEPYMILFVIFVSVLVSCLAFKMATLIFIK